jgi:hypothetical protein
VTWRAEGRIFKCGSETWNPGGICHWRMISRWVKLSCLCDTMRLIVSGLRSASSTDRFYALFGRYVYGFNSWTHCDRCFVARQERKVNPAMRDGVVALKDELFYL